MSRQWDVRELEWYGVERVQIGDTIKNEDGTISKVVEKHNGSIWTDSDKIPEKNRLRMLIRLIIKMWNYRRINDR